MVATVFLIEYGSYGALRSNNEDDGSGTGLAQVPGEIIDFHELDAATAKNVELSPRTVFVGFESFGGDVWFNFDAADDAGDTLVSGSRDRLGVGRRGYQGVWDQQNNTQRYTEFNCVDVS